MLTLVIPTGVVIAKSGCRASVAGDPVHPAGKNSAINASATKNGGDRFGPVIRVSPVGRELTGAVDRVGKGVMTALAIEALFLVKVTVRFLSTCYPLSSSGVFGVSPELGQARRCHSNRHQGGERLSGQIKNRIENADRPETPLDRSLPPTGSGRHAP
jgi:hypothetical protein